MSVYGTKLNVFMNVNKETGLNFSSCLFVRALVPYSPSDVWLIRRKERRGEERRGGGWSHGWSVLLVVAAGGDANSDNQRGKGGKAGVGWGPKTERGFHRRVICEEHFKDHIKQWFYTTFFYIEML